MKFFKSTIAAIVVIAGVITLDPVAKAAEQSKSNRPSAAGERGQGMRQRMQEMADEMGLSDEQKDKLRMLFMEQMDKMRELRDLPPQERMEKMKAMRDEVEPQLKKVLTTEQFEQWQEKQGKLFGQMAQMGGKLQEAFADLNLTDEQKEKIRSLFQEHGQKFMEIRNLPQAERMEKLKSLSDEIQPKLKEVLTSEQFAKWQKKQKEFFDKKPDTAPAQRMQDFIKDLNLTDEQKEKLQPLFHEQMGKIREIRQDDSLSPQEKLAKVRAVRKEVAPKVKEVLDAEQFEKWEKAVNQNLDDMQKRSQQKREKKEE